ncbi:glutamate decarboxylase [Streptantibioticus ferralitis]|uniref:Glutamate decarboxylase n=1 Tax=Streptantibioticus ferralitis TaxID=236510 RepID=A0ABT5YT40_9ACTN|nr:glutamate decarboxylase [Streptantibioticus ferralitis]MDF2254772.1 glutamate decarboxylase [Streptantibioticus ferralitis]
MPLHRVDQARQYAPDDLYALPGSFEPLPRYRIPEGTMPARAAYQLVHDELLLDGNSRQNLATFCTTWAEPEVQTIMAEALDKNLIDKDEYPQTAEIESRCVHILADLWHAPDGSSAVGCSTTGSSEAAMLAGLAMQRRWRARRRAAGQSTERPNLVCGPVQVCWEKFGRYFDVELRQIPLLPDSLTMRPEQLADYCDENTIGVVATLGVTFNGEYEPVAEIAGALDELQQRTGFDIPVHVDAASGGFVAPFLQPDLEWDFRLERVKSINASGHKFGLSPLGVGWAIWREAAYLPEELVFHVDYLGGDMPTFALNFSRPGGEVIAQYYNLVRLGRDGFTAVQEACAKVAARLADAIAELGPFSVLHDGRSGLPAVCWTLTRQPRPDSDDWTLYDLSERLRLRGWQVPTYPLPADRSDVAVQRVVVRHGVSRDLAELLLDDLKAALTDIRRRHLSGAEQQPGFHH